VQTRLADEAAVGLLDLHRREIADQLLGRRKAASALLGQLHGDLGGALQAQEVEAKRVGHLRGDQVAIRRQRAQIVLAEDEQRPVLAGVERPAERGEEVAFGPGLARGDCEDLLELIEEQHHRAVGPALAAGAALDVLEEVEPASSAGLWWRSGAARPRG
jgi:hypothetical protein